MVQGRAIMDYELNIFTNDGWVVTLVTDKPVNLGDVRMSTIIVQPKEDHYRRIEQNPNTIRAEYRLKKKWEV
jgi:sporulation protein YlmC with PRC-barrel domain